jgi:hypothetical protein
MLIHGVGVLSKRFGGGGALIGRNRAAEMLCWHNIEPVLLFRVAADTVINELYTLRILYVSVS